MRIARCVTSHFESYGLPVTDSDTLAMNEPFTPKALRFSRPIEMWNGEAATSAALGFVSGRRSKIECFRIA